MSNQMNKYKRFTFYLHNKDNHTLDRLMIVDSRGLANIMGIALKRIYPSRDIYTFAGNGVLSLPESEIGNRIALAGNDTNFDEIFKRRDVDNG